MNKIINMAVIAHVDAGKSTLIDGILDSSNIFSDHDKRVDCVMDSNDLERERGITIYSKNCAVYYKDTKLNIVDTPGHADFSSEVERIMRTLDGALLLVDATEGPMPQTRFVLQKALERGLKPIVVINKIDKKDARIDEVLDECLDLFDELGATEEQLDFPVLYAIAKQGIVKREVEDEVTDMRDLFELIVEHVEPFEKKDDQPLQIQISSLQYDEYIGRLGIGRILSGTVKEGMSVERIDHDKNSSIEKIAKVFVYEGLKKVSVSQASSGDMVVLAGISDISIGDTLGEQGKIKALSPIPIEEPTLSMTFYINNSPFAGKSGNLLTTRQIRQRLLRELETNVGLRVEEIENSDAYKVSGRGELHLSILLENMRREGFELSVSKPEVLYKVIDGKRKEPYELVNISAPSELLGSVMEEMGKRKGIVQAMDVEGEHQKVEYIIPSRGLLGYRSQFITQTKGEGILVSRFSHFGDYAGEIEGRKNGVLVSIAQGEAMGYALNNLEQRATLFIRPSDPVYEGMIIGLNSRSEDMDVNPTKNKKLTNTRASGSDDAINLSNPKEFTLEEALEFIDTDEWVEITPDAIRLRKTILDTQLRAKSKK